MDKALTDWLKQALTPEPLFESVNSRELVCSAIVFNSPERIPYSLINPVRSDFFELAALLWRKRHQENSEDDGEKTYYDEWHIKRQRAKGLFDQVIEYPLSQLEKLDQYTFPPIPNPERVKQHHPILKQAFDAGKYVVGYDAVNLYDRVVSLTGLQTALLAPYQDTQQFESLLDQLTELTLAQIEQYGETGWVQGFMTWQDFGTQNSLVMNLNNFRKFYRPRLQQMIDAAHANGMHYIWHCCGAIVELIPEMIEMGVDVVQLDQAKLIGYETLADRFGGKICFWNALDTLWSVQQGLSDEEIRAEIADMHQSLSGFNGGVMFRHYPQAKDIGLSGHVLQVIAEEFVR